MQSGLLYIFQSLVDLYLIAVALRLGMQWVRADWRNPIVQFVVNVTNPLVVPLQKVLAPMYKIDTATLVVYLVLQLGLLLLLTWLGCAVMPDILSLLWLAIIRGVRMLLNVYFFVIFAYILMSWISAGGGHNPSLAMLGKMLRELSTPVLAPVRKLVPPVAGWDLSPLFVLLLLGAATNYMLPELAFGVVQGFACQVRGIL